MNNFDFSASRCFHCGESIPDNTTWSVVIDDQPRAMCCPGCEAVAQAIIDGGLNDYYQHRTELPALTPSEIDQANIEARDTLLFFDSPALQKQFVARQEDNSEATFVIEGISCAACSWLIEHRLKQLQGINEASLNLSNHRLYLNWKTKEVHVSTLMEALLRLGYKATPFSATQEEATRGRENKVFIRRLALSGFGMMQMMMMAIPTYSEMTNLEEFFLRFAQMLLSIPVILYSGAPFFRAAMRDLRTRHLSMDVPVSLAIILAFGASIYSTFHQGENVYFSEVCMFIFFLLVGRYFEMRARHRMNRAGNNLLTLLPNLALRINANGEEQLIAANDINIGDLLRVKPGQTIAADGIVIEGISSVDEAALTGEYLPVKKEVNSQLIGGTINVESPLLMKVTAVGAEAQISTIIRLLDRAQQAKPKAALIADQVANYFIWAVLFVSLVVYFAWIPIGGAEKAFYVVLSILVVTCPCALALATPTALTAATAALRERGWLISRSHALETLPQIHRVVFDKTGTLTQGRLTLEQVLTLGEFDEKSVLALAAGLEKYSTHPIAQAFTHIEPALIHQPQQLAGLGVQGQYQHQNTILELRLGRADYVWPQNPPKTPDDQGQWLLLASQEQPLAWFQLNDVLRTSAPQLIKGLQQRGLKISLLTGDPSPSGPRIAKALQIKDVKIGMTPEEKLATVQAWQRAGEKVLMVGDGINDVPVLAGADLSLAVNEASDLAKTNADSLLTNGQLETLLFALDKGRTTRRIISQNHAWAIGYNILALPAAAAGVVLPWQAAIGMSLSSVLVVANAMRLLTTKSRK